MPVEVSTFGSGVLAGTPSSFITTFSDSFTRANGDVGTNWLSQMRGDFGAGVEYRPPSWQILGNNLRITANGNVANSSEDSILIPRLIATSNKNTSSPAGLWGKNQFVRATFRGSGAGGLRHGIAVLATSDTGGSVNECQGYHLIDHVTGGVFTAIDLIKRIGGQNEAGNTFTVLATSAVAPTAGDVWELDGVFNAAGTSITLTFLKNGTQVFQTVDNSPLPAKGYPAFTNTTCLGAGATSDWNNFVCGGL